MTMARMFMLGKLCFTYCGDERCNCECSPDYRAAKDALAEYETDGGVSLEQLKAELESSPISKLKGAA